MSLRKQKEKTFLLEEWESELEKRLKKLTEFLKYKNHGFCRKYLNHIIKDFFKNRK